jgi:hypothetical protein
LRFAGIQELRSYHFPFIGLWIVKRWRQLIPVAPIVAATDLAALGAVVQIIKRDQIVDVHAVLPIIAYHNDEDIATVEIVNPFPFIARFFPLVSLIVRAKVRVGFPRLRITRHVHCNRWPARDTIARV